MQQALADRLRCPTCLERLGLQVEEGTPADVRAGWLDCYKCVQRFPVVDGIPRFVPVAHDAERFGRLWESFRHTVLDSTLGVTHSRERFFRETGWTCNNLRDQWLLEIGCGAGRFTEIALDCGAHVVAIDCSTAIDVCRRNLGAHPRLHLVQADLYSLPFRPQGYDFLCSFGVLHRTPDARRALLALPAQLKDGGKLAVDIAPPRWFRQFGPTAWLRAWTQRMPMDRALTLGMKLTSWLLPCQQALGRIPGIGRRLQSWFPIAPVEAFDQCTPAAVKERACLAMCDRLTSVHHHPSRLATLQSWLQEAGLDEINTFRDALIVGRGVKRCKRAA